MPERGIHTTPPSDCAAGSLRVPEGVSIAYSTQLPQHVTFAGTLARMDELVAVLRATADEMETNLAVRRA